MWTKSPKEIMLDALFNSGPIEPRHARPASLTDGWGRFQSPSGDRFFSDFEMFPDQLNQLFTPNESREGAPWRLQELPETLIKRSCAGPEFGRRYSVFYNQANIGVVEINPSLDYDAEINPNVYTNIELEHVRLLPFHTILGFIVTLLGEPRDAEILRAIDRSLLAVLWNKDDDDDSPTLDLFLHNSVAHYLRWRICVLNSRPKNAIP
jgi:hypothetical protein